MSSFFYIIEDIIPEILSFLTTYEIYQFLYSSKQFKNEYTNVLYQDSFWLSILYRDFPLFDHLHDSSYTKIQSLSNSQIAFMLENGKICYNCYFYQGQYCSHTLYLKDLYSFFLLKKGEIENLSSIYCGIGMCRLYSTCQIFSLLSEKYKGITNFFIQRPKIKQFVKWKRNYNKKFTYERMTKKEKKTFLEVTLWKYGIKMRNDSKVCKNFINGKIKMNIDQLVVILKVTNLLYSFGSECYKKNHVEYKNKMEMLMFENKNNKSFTWMDAYNKILE